MANHSIALFACVAIMIVSPCELRAQRAGAPLPPSMQSEPRGRGFPMALVSATGRETVLPGLDDEFQYSDPVLSPDGKRLALMATEPFPFGTPFPPPLAASHIAIYSLPAGPVVHLFGPGHNYSASWVGTTGDVSYLRRMTRSDTTVSLFARSADGAGTEREVLSNERVTITGTAWLSDGKSFLLAHTGTGTKPRGQLLHFSLDRITKPKSVVSNNLLPRLPVMSPDGKLFAFVASTPPSGTSVSGTSRVFVRRVSGGAPVAVSRASGDYPTWSTDGSRLFYLSPTSRLILGVRVNNTGKLSLGSPVAVSDYKVEVAVSRIAVLPGDSLFALRSRPDTPPPSVVASEVRAARADSSTQKLLELVVANALTPLATQKRIDLSKFALDSRSYFMFADPVFAGAPQRIDSYLLPGRDEPHLASLAAILGVAGSVYDAPSCPAGSTPPPCRRSAFRGVVDFSPALVSADSARIYVHTWPAVSSPNSVGIITRWAFTLVRSGSEWTIRRVE